MRPVVDETGQKLCGPGRFHPGGVLKSAMQRLEQGDVVTGAQFARQVLEQAPEWLNAFVAKGVNLSPLHRALL